MVELMDNILLETHVIVVASVMLDGNTTVLTKMDTVTIRTVGGRNKESIVLRTTELNVTQRETVWSAAMV